jgi:hypothetical protein
MSLLLAERPLGRVRKCRGRKALRHFYAPFVDPTEARNDFNTRGRSTLGKLARTLLVRRSGRQSRHG